MKAYTGPRADASQLLRRSGTLSAPRLCMGWLWLTGSIKL